MIAATPFDNPDTIQTALFASFGTLIVVGVIAIPFYGCVPLLVVIGGVIAATAIAGALLPNDDEEAPEEN